jgi:hypothetical protein
VVDWDGVAVWGVAFHARRLLVAAGLLLGLAVVEEGLASVWEILRLGEAGALEVSYSEISAALVVRQLDSQPVEWPLPGSEEQHLAEE